MVFPDENFTDLELADFHVLIQSFLGCCPATVPALHCFFDGKLPRPNPTCLSNACEVVVQWGHVNLDDAAAN